MKKTILLSLCAAAIFSAGTMMTNAATNNDSTTQTAGQPVDLTVAAERALPCVVHIKYLQNSKIQEVEMRNDPFGDMFDLFGFFG